MATETIMVMVCLVFWLESPLTCTVHIFFMLHNFHIQFGYILSCGIQCHLHEHFHNPEYKIHEHVLKKGELKMALDHFFI